MKAGRRSRTSKRGLLEVDMHADQDVLDYGHLAEKADILEGAGDAAGGDLIGPQFDQGPAVEVDLALVGLIDAGQGIEEGGFAGAVGSDDADDPAGLQLKIDPVDGGQAAERFDDVDGFQKRHDPLTQPLPGRLPACADAVLRESGRPGGRSSSG